MEAKIQHIEQNSSLEICFPLINFSLISSFEFSPDRTDGWADGWIIKEMIHDYGKGMNC